MLVGYARVSTDDQNLDLQRDALNNSGCTEIFEDQISGVKSDRPGLKEANKRSDLNFPIHAASDVVLRKIFTT